MEKLKHFGAPRLLALFLIFCGLGYIAAEARRTVTLEVDGQSHQFMAWAWTVEQTIAYSGIAISEYDQITPPLQNRTPRDGKITIVRAATFQIDVDGEIITVIAANPIPKLLINEAGITLNPGDKLYNGLIEVDLDEPIQTSRRNVTWQIHREKPFVVHEGSMTSQIQSSAATIGQALWENGYKLKFADRIDPPSLAVMSPDIEVHIQNARPVHITTAGFKIDSFSAASTIAEAISDAGFSLLGLDYTIPSDIEPIPANGEIRLVRVREEVSIEHTPIPFETSYQAVNDLEIDRQTILETGEYGLEAQRIRVRYEDDIEVIRQIEETWVTQEPQNQLIGYGTQIIMRSMDTPDGLVSYWRSLQVYAVSYNPTSAGGDTTASGRKLEKGIIAVNPNYIPYGTLLYVPGYGFGVAADTGRLPPRWIDLGYSDEDYVSWHHNVTVYFVWPPPGNIVWIIP
jgi:resuscitation-promoting factor RpfB